MRHTWFVNHYDGRYRYTCKSDEPGRKLTWAVWSWHDTPAGSYRVEVFIPPQEATAIVEYEIGRDSAGLITDPVRLNQSHHRGSWATVANVDFPGGRLWLQLGDDPSEASGSRDWCAWGGDHSIGAAKARIVATGTAITGTEAPGAPRNVDAAAHGTRQLRVTWSSPSDSGSSAIKHYRVRYSRPAIGNSPAWSGSATSTGTSHTSGNLRYGTTYTVTVTAVNRDDRASGPATDTATTRSRETTAPMQPRNVNASAHGTRQIRVTWLPPLRSGSSAVKHYRVQYSRDALLCGGSTWRSRLYTTTGTSHTSGNLRYGTTYTVTVTAVNRDDRASRPATTDSMTEGTSTSIKYTVERDGVWPSPHRITSKRQFETIAVDGVRDSVTVHANTKGGIVSSGNVNLAQSGCSWVGFDAEVVDEALIEENAVVTGEAKVSDSARVSGNATVSGNARVRGEARVSDRALVTGRAIVEGEAEVSGDARIVGDMRIESGVFDGKQEHKRAVQAIRREIRSRLTEELKKCGIGDENTRMLVNDILNPTSSSRDTHLVIPACRYFDAIRSLTPTPFEVAFGFAFGLVGASRLPLYVRSLLATLESVESIRQIKTAGDTMTRVISELEKAYYELP